MPWGMAYMGRSVSCRTSCIVTQKRLPARESTFQWPFTYFDLYDSRDKFTPTLLRAASLCFTVWVYSVRMPHRDAAVQRMISLLMNTSVEIWNQWYLLATIDCTSPWHVSKAFLRDLSDPNVLDARLTSRYMIFTKFCMRPLNALFDNAVERLVIWYSLASYRRQLCSGHMGENNEVQRGFGFDAIEVSYNFVT